MSGYGEKRGGYQRRPRDNELRPLEVIVDNGNVDRAMQSLPPDQREAVLLVMVEGYAYKEAAEIVGCPVGTLNSRLVRGRDALMAELGEAS